MMQFFLIQAEAPSWNVFDVRSSDSLHPKDSNAHVIMLFLAGLFYPFTQLILVPPSINSPGQFLVSLSLNLYLNCTGLCANEKDYLDGKYFIYSSLQIYLFHVTRLGQYNVYSPMLHGHFLVGKHCKSCHVVILKQLQDKKHW